MQYFGLECDDCEFFCDPDSTHICDCCDPDVYNFVNREPNIEEFDENVHTLTNIKTNN